MVSGRMGTWKTKGRRRGREGGREGRVM